MKAVRSFLGGKPISREQALKGLGNPNKWKADAAELMSEFRKKPAPRVSLMRAAKKLLESAREAGKAARGILSELGEHEPMFAGSTAKKKRKQERRRSLKPRRQRRRTKSKGKKRK